MIFEFISVVLQIVIPGCLYQLNLINLNEFDFLSFAGSHIYQLSDLLSRLLSHFGLLYFQW